MNRLSRLLMASFVCAAVSLAQSVPQTVARPETPLILPLDYSGGHLYVTLSADGIGTVVLLLDSGATRTSLSSEAVSGQTSQEHWQKHVAIGGYGAKRQKQPYRTVDLTLRSGAAQVFHGPALTLPPDALSRALAHPVNGVLGWDFLRGWCTTLNYHARSLTLRPLNGCSQPLQSDGTMKAIWKHEGLLLDAVLTFANGRKARAELHFDTGSDGGVFLSERYRSVAGLNAEAAPGGQMHGVGVNGDYIADLAHVTAIDFEQSLFTLTPDKDSDVAIGRKDSFAHGHWWTGDFFRHPPRRRHRQWLFGEDYLDARPGGQTHLSGGSA